MSWFLLQDQPVRSKRKGIWLKTESESIEDVISEVMKLKVLRCNEWFYRIEIKEMRPDNMVLLEVWARSRRDLKKARYNVFYVLMAENPKWACHGDLGRGLDVPKEKIP